MKEGRRGLSVGKRVLQSVVILTAFFFLGKYTYQRWLEVGRVDIGFVASPLVVANLLLLVFYFGYSQSWQRMLGWMSDESHTVGRLALYRVFFVSLVSRYLPAGSLLQWGGRVELFKRVGGRRAFGVQSLYYEQLYLIGGAGLLAWLAAFLRPVPWLPGSLAGQGLPWLGVGVLYCSLLLTIPDFAVRAGARLVPSVFARLDRILPSLHFAHRVELLIRFFLVNLAQGAAVYFVLWSIYPSAPSIPGLAILTAAAYPLGRIAGQLAPFVPGGIGVREGAFTILLGPFLPVQPIILCAAIFRLISVLMELTILLMLVSIMRLRWAREDVDVDSG